MDFNKLTRKQSGLLILVVYLFTMFIGTFIYIIGVGLIFHPFIVMLIVDIVMTLIIFVIGLIIKNASLYDPYWSIIPVFILLLWIPVYIGSFRTLKTILVFSVVLIWSIRLTYNWWKNWTGFKVQDWRYDLLREKNIKLYPITNLFGIHLIPTLVVYVQMIVIYKVLLSSTLNLGTVLGLLISLSAPIIQYIADKQMYDFRNNNREEKKVIDVGLWKLSRHPNYLGELLFWTGFYVMYVFTYYKFDAMIIFPILMILLFVFISIPMMENKIKNRPGYEEYKKSVPMILPKFGKK